MSVYVLDASEATVFEDLALSIAAVEHSALARLDELIAQLLPVPEADQTAAAPEPAAALDADETPRRGRHLADEVGFSIHSFAGGRVPRHRVDDDQDFFGIAS